MSSPRIATVRVEATADELLAGEVQRYRLALNHALKRAHEAGITVFVTVSPVHDAGPAFVSCHTCRIQDINGVWITRNDG